MTAGAFCLWVSDDLLPNVTLEPGYPQRISMETARQWLHHLGFEVLSLSKELYLDGHEREDVVKAHGSFLKKNV